MSNTIPPAGISAARQYSIQGAAITMVAGLDALALMAGNCVDDATVPTDTVRWFVEKFRKDIDLILDASDGDAEEPEAQS